MIGAGKRGAPDQWPYNQGQPIRISSPVQARLPELQQEPKPPAAKEKPQAQYPSRKCVQCGKSATAGPLYCQPNGDYVHLGCGARAK